jgi:hypothetical protein
MPKYNFNAYLLATPFEPSLNLGGTLTPEIFFNDLYISHEGEKKSQRVEFLIDKVKKIFIDDEYEDIKQTLFLDGYKGVGKTSFLRFLERQNPTWNFTFLDFIRDDRKDANTIDPFKSHSLYYLKATNNDVTDFKQFIKAKANALIRHFHNSSADLLNFDGKDTNSYFKILDNAESKDTFRFFLLYLVRKKLLRRLRQNDSYKYDFIVLDNLDAIDLAKITSLVKDDFTQIIDNFLNILQDKDIFSEGENNYVDFENTFRFILCLRDSNKAIINPHRRDRLVTNAISFSLSNFESSLYDYALQKRLNFYIKERGSQYSEEVSHLVSLMKDLSEENFFKSIVCPLYNWNFREIVGIYRVLKNLIEAEKNLINGLPKLFQKTDKKLSRTGMYGKFGAIFFHIIKVLREDNFLKKYPFDETDTEELEKNGYCVPLRVLLTVLLNKSNVSKVSDILEDGKSCEDISVIDLYNEVKQVIEKEDFCRTLSDMFNFHKNSWGHLITCRKDSIDSPNDVERILDSNNEQVEISLNPAGFVSLRSVFTHFEFYSVLFSISDKPLFLVGLQKSGGEYLFEIIIEKVFSRVNIHCKYMRIFYKRKFLGSANTGGLEMSDERYLSSPFAFRHFQFSESSQNKKGLFHASRLATYHITYIDKFRKWIMENSNENEETLKIINEKLISSIKKYRGILDEWEGLNDYKQEIDENLIQAGKDIHKSISPHNTKVRN